MMCGQGKSQGTMAVSWLWLFVEGALGTCGRAKDMVESWWSFANGRRICGWGAGMDSARSEGQRPYFFWDYDIREDEIRGILAGANGVEKAWVISRILQYAKWEDIWRYLKPEDIRQNLALLHFRLPQDRDAWSYAVERWSRSG